MSIAPPEIDWSVSALLIDVDGTLLHIRPHPDDVVADADLVALLTEVHRRLDGAFALVSGRPIAELDRIFAPATFTAVGAHGAEFRSAGGRQRREATATLPDAALQQIGAFADAEPGLLAEFKTFGAALHFRRASHLEDRCREMMQKLAQTLGADFRLIEGKMVLELTPRSHDKGVAIRKMLEDEPFTGRVPVFVGDDVTDEDGFREVNRLSGVSVRVGQSESTEARFVIDDVDTVHRWLLEIVNDDSTES